jgi:methionyl-tRNA synthetase
MPLPDTISGMARKYITTAIDYPNAAPHMGHVLEKVLADVIARWFRLSGHDVRFQIGTDEHGIKIQQTAKKQGMTPAELVEKNVPLFQDLYAKLNVSADHFIRTTDQREHWPTVQELWKKLQAAGALEKRTYTGLYCSGCERFVTAKDLVDGKCPDHNIPPEEVKEENWFFLLSRESEWLKKLLKSDYRIIPDYRAEETLALLDRGLEDVSFSRPKSSLSWGIPVLGDENQTMYVWCDALTNYISGLGLLTDHAQNQYWNDAEVTHVIGKDIARFHALIWPAMLKNAGIRTPDQLLIHGFVTSEGQKMSKSLGNVVDPVDVLTRFNGNPDPMRFFLCHEIPVGRDGDFSWKRLEEMYQSKLGNQLGNMLNRTLVLLKKDDGVVQFPSGTEDLQQTAKLWSDYGAKMDAYEIHAGIQSVTDAVSVMNTAFNNSAPWTIKDDATKRIETLGSFAECLRHAALMLLPFMPDTAYRISKQLNVPYAEQIRDKDFVITDQLKQWGGCPEWTEVGEPSILFDPLS